MPECIRYPTVWLLLAGCLAGGCATTAPDSPSYIERAITTRDGPLTISVAALSVRESNEVYARPLAAHGIQPVWMEVENRDSETYWFLPLGLDPNYFPYWEAAAAFTTGKDSGFDNSERERFRALGFPLQIAPGTTRSGFVLTHLEEGFKFIHVDFLRSGQLRSGSALVDVPGFRADYKQNQKGLEQVAPMPPHVIDYGDDQAAFRRALNDLPCCTSNKRGSRTGDPLNLVLVGGVDDAFAALAERGWRATEITWAGSLLRMLKSVLSGEPYVYAPVSPLYFDGRVQDFALQKARDNIHQRNHLRLWRAPMLYQGKGVWVGQVSRDIGSRLTIHSPYLTTHKIDPDVDEARAALAGDLVYTGLVAELGWVKGVGAAERDNPSRNLTTDPYYTDGQRLVMIFDRRTTPINHIGLLPWEEADVETATGD
jgi:hypothetical protein